MKVAAKLSYLRIAPRKVRMVADLIRGRRVGEAQTILNFTVKKAASPLVKLLKSAISNAKHNTQTQDESNLYISKIVVDEGPRLKRWRARSRGMAARIQKRTSHITIVLDEIDKKVKKIKKLKEARKGPASTQQKIEKTKKIERTKFKPEIIIEKPKVARGIKKIFKRKAF